MVLRVRLLAATSILLLRGVAASLSIRSWSEQRTRDQRPLPQVATATLPTVDLPRLAPLPPPRPPPPLSLAWLLPVPSPAGGAGVGGSWAARPAREGKSTLREARAPQASLLARGATTKAHLAQRIERAHLERERDAHVAALTASLAHIERQQQELLARAAASAQPPTLGEALSVARLEIVSSALGVVPMGSLLAEAQLPSLLQQLGAGAPAWTARILHYTVLAHNSSAAAGSSDDDGPDLLALVLDQQNFWLAGGTVLTWAILVTLTACLYATTKQHPQAGGVELPMVGDRVDHVLYDGIWNFHLLQCMHEPTLCLFSCFCGSIRWADTMRMGKLLNFLVAFALFMSLSVISMLGFGIAAVFLVMLCVWYRQKIRKIFNIPYGTCTSIMQDCCVYCFCSVCAIVQEARQIELAWKARHAAVNPPPIDVARA